MREQKLKSWTSVFSEFALRKGFLSSFPCLLILEAAESFYINVSPLECGNVDGTLEDAKLKCFTSPSSDNNT